MKKFYSYELVNNINMIIVSGLIFAENEKEAKIKLNNKIIELLKDITKNEYIKIELAN